MKCSLPGCNRIFGSQKGLEIHLRSSHRDITNKEYTIKYFYNNLEPSCECGCNTPTKYYCLGRFSRFVSGHNTFVRETPFINLTKENLELGQKRAIENRNKKYAIYGHPNAKPKVEVECKNCGKVDEVIPALKMKKFCSKNCYAEYKKNNPEEYPITEETLKKRKERTITEKTKRRLRISNTKDWLKKRGLNSPNHNLKACYVFDRLNEDFGINIRHGQNGGEYHCDKTGYWADGLEPKYKLWIEWDEPSHFLKSGVLRNKDITRQNEIETFTNYTMVRIKQDTFNYSELKNRIKTIIN